jgi:Secretion system C-terminal sorting domain
LVFQNKYNMIRGTKVLTFLLLICANGFSQELSHQVLVPAAGLVSTNTLSYSQTIGETAIEIIGSSGFVFTQGFQQPGIKIAPETAPDGNGVDVYPNPATDYIKVKFFGDVARNFKVDVINIAGTIVSSMTTSFITRYYDIQQIDFAKLKYGFYFVRVVSDDGKISRTFKIEKM